MNRKAIASKSEKYNSSGHTRKQWAVAILVNLTSFTYGLQLGWVSPMTKILQSSESPMGRPLTDAEISLVAGIPSLSAVVGIAMLLYVVDTFGRRLATLLIAVCQLTCWIIKLCPISFNGLLVARIFCGIGAGGCYHTVPMYIKELSQDNIRGTLVSMIMMIQNVGIIIMYSLGGYLNYYTILYLVVGLPLLNVLLILKAPESPSFLVKKGKSEEAAETLANLRGLHVTDKQVITEMNIIQREHEYFNSIPNITFCSIFKNKAWCRGFLIMVMLISIHGLSGVFFIINYASNLLSDSQVNIDPKLQSLSVPIFLTIGTLFAMTAVDKLGRKILLGITFTISTVTFSGLATSILLRMYGWSSPGWLSVVALLITVCCYGAAICPIPFVLSSEMFNFQIRARLMACLSALSWLMSFVQIIILTAINSYFGAHATFYICAVINLLGLFLTISILPETCGKSVEQIENDLRKGRKNEAINLEC